MNNGFDLVQKQILDESDELLARMTPIRTNGGMHTTQPDLERVIGGLHLELASLASKVDQLEAKLNAVDDQHNKLVNSLTRTFQEKNISARLGELEKRNESLVKRIAAVEEGGVKFSGSYQRGNEYKRGEMCAYDGSIWCAVVDTKPLEIPGQCACWQLAVRGHRDEPRQPTKGVHPPSIVERRT